MEVCCVGLTGEDGPYIYLVPSLKFLCREVTRSQSRMRGDYLFYEEKMETTQEEKDAKAALRYQYLSSTIQHYTYWRSTEPGGRLIHSQFHPQPIGEEIVRTVQTGSRNRHIQRLYTFPDPAIRVNGMW